MVVVMSGDVRGDERNAFSTTSTQPITRLACVVVSMVFSKSNKERERESKPRATRVTRDPSCWKTRHHRHHDTTTKACAHDARARVAHSMPSGEVCHG